jgi:hypothetical protein
LFENKEQEILRFAVKAASDKTIVKSLEVKAYSGSLMAS